MDFKKLITRARPVIFDIGCNDGEQTEIFCRLFPDADIYAFEPEPRAIAKFKARNLRAYLFEGVVSHLDGYVLFHRCNTDINPGWDKSGSILAPKTLLESHPWLTWTNDIVVPTVTLDRFVFENVIGKIDFVWADVQGAEEMMIQGGSKTFERHVRYLYTEYSIGELYDSAPSLDRILTLLPNYEIVEYFNTNEYGGDILLRNMLVR